MGVFRFLFYQIDFSLIFLKRVAFVKFISRKISWENHLSSFCRGSLRYASFCQLELDFYGNVLGEENYKFYTFINLLMGFFVGFVFDQNISKSNKKKHGIAFIEVQMLWGDPNLIQIPSQSLDEDRVIIIGEILGKIVLV